MDQRELNDNVGGVKNTSSEDRDHFSRTFVRSNLDSLRECRDSLSQAERETFRSRYGTIDTLIDVVVDDDAIRALIGFFDPRHRCFILPKLDLAFTVEEYHHLANATWVTESLEPYTPDLDDLATKGKALKPRLQQLGKGISHAHMEGALHTMNNKAYLDWSRMFRNMGAGWKNNLKSTTRVKFFTLGLFGLVLFPYIPDRVESRVLELVNSQTDPPSRNIMPMVIAETLRACVYMKTKGDANFRCCTQLFTIWIHSHFRFEEGMKCAGPYMKADHILKFKDQGRRDWDEEIWHNRFTSIEDHEVIWKAPWLSGPLQYLAPPLGQFWIPLFGVYGAISYSPHMAMRQLGGEQDEPRVYAMDTWDIEYSQRVRNSAELISMKEAWRTCRRLMVPEGECTEAYKTWRQGWVKDRKTPKKPRRTVYRELAEARVMNRRLEQQIIGLQARTKKLEFKLREGKHEVQRSNTREAEMDSLYEEMRALCEDMEDGKDRAEMRLEFKIEDCSRLRRGKEELKSELGVYVSFLERYRTRIMGFRKEMKEMKARLAQSEERESKLKRKCEEMGSEMAKLKEVIAHSGGSDSKLKRKCEEMGSEIAKLKEVIAHSGESDNKLKRKCEEMGSEMAKLNEVIVDSDGQAAEFKGVLDGTKAVRIIYKLKMEASQKGGGVRCLLSLIDQDEDIQTIVKGHEWLRGLVKGLKWEINKIAVEAEGKQGPVSSNSQELWTRVEARIQTVFDVILGGYI